MIQPCHKRFVVGIDRAKMRLYDCEQSAQDDILDSGQDEEYTYEEQKPKNHLRDSSSHERLLSVFNPEVKRSLTVVSREMQSILWCTRNKYWDGHYFTFNPLPGDIIEMYLMQDIFPPVTS